MKLANEEGLIYLQWGNTLRESVYVCATDEVVGIHTSGRTVTIDLPHEVSTSVIFSSEEVAESAHSWLSAHSLARKELELPETHEDGSESIPDSPEGQGGGDEPESLSESPVGPGGIAYRWCGKTHVQVNHAQWETDYGRWVRYQFSTVNNGEIVAPYSSTEDYNTNYPVKIIDIFDEMELRRLLGVE